MSSFLKASEYISWCRSLDYDTPIFEVPTVDWISELRWDLGVKNNPNIPGYFNSENKSHKSIQVNFIEDFRIFDNIDMSEFSFASLSVMLANLRVPKSNIITLKYDFDYLDIVYFRNGKFHKSKF